MRPVEILWVANAADCHLMAQVPEGHDIPVIVVVVDKEEGAQGRAGVGGLYILE